jgi:filamentous hemagglutinin family protein
MKIQRKIKRNIKRALSGAALAAMLITTPAFALPQNPNVIVGNGQITIDDGAGGVMNIAVGANGVIDWSSFSIAGGETVNFNFANAMAVLNRVTGNSMSELHGALNSTGANGSIFLVNPNGVLVGSGATINANNLVLSTLDVSNDNFMKWANGEVDIVSFAKKEQDAIAKSVIVEGGTFSIKKNLDLIGGSVTIAPGVSIEINGEVYLIAGDKVDRSSDEVLSVASQLDNRVSVAGNLKGEGVWVQGGNINVETAEIEGEWTDLIAAKQYEVGDTTDHIYATPENKLSITNSKITIDGDENESAMLIGGRIVMTGSDISIDEAHHVGIIAANHVQSKYVSESAPPPYFRGANITADSTNTITLNDVSITSVQDGPVFILGGKVNTTGISDIKGGEVFIGAGSKLGVEADSDEYYFTDYFKSGLGNTVNLGQGTTLVANGEAAIYANAVTNAGAINAHGHYGINIRAVDERNFNEAGNIGYQISSKNNQVINTGTIFADQANFDSGADPEYGIIGIAASVIDNTGTIEARRHQDAPWPDKTTGAAELLAVGTVTGVDGTDESIKVAELNRDLDNYNYKLVWQGEGDMEAPGIVETLPLNGGATNPAIDEILNGSGSLADKQQQIIVVINTINDLPANEQPAAVVGAIHSIVRQESLSQREKESLLSSVVNSYEGTAAGRTESNNQTSINQASTAGNANSSNSTFAASESESNVIIQ